MEKKIFEDLNKKLPLSQKDNENRKKLLYKENQSEISYNVSLALRSKLDKSTYHDLDYDGQVIVKFNYFLTLEQLENSKDKFCTETNLFLDIYNYPVLVIINDKQQNEIVLKDQKLFLSNSDLKINGEENIVKIYFHANYSNAGKGLHHYTDPSDQKEYLYTQLEPNDCHKVFPCFDQPNLKAKIDLIMITPQKWNTYSNEYEKEVILLEKLNSDELKSKCLLKYDDKYFDFLINDNALNTKNYKMTIFHLTYKISTYLFAIAAGEYVSFENVCQPDYKVKMRVIYRDSLKQYQDSQEIIRITIEGINFYETYFKTPYPFNKYDQIFVPELTSGAMENVGLVTFNECYVWKSPPTYRRQNGFAITVLHELAHMWFGNLVTMDWWDDLWLNEAFATFISHLVMAEKLSDKYSLSWILFNFWKALGYREDQLITTHPVMGECVNTEVAETSFDSITYEKGSAILKQIFYIVGYENFSKAIHNYFSKHSWKNTIYDDFINEMELVSNNISDQSASWLKKAGLTSIIPFINENGDLTIIQEACLEEHNSLQTLVMDIALYDENEIKILKKVVILPQRETLITKNYIIQQIGEFSPNAILLNFNDWSYVKVLLDKLSIEYFKNNLNKMTDLLPKLMIYRAFFDMLRDSLISGLEYVDLITNFLSHEDDVDIITTQLRYLIGAVSSYMPLRFYDIYSEKIFFMCIEMLGKFQNNPDKIEIIKNILLIINSLTCTKPTHDLLISWISNKQESEYIEFTFKDQIIKFKSIYLSQEERFSIIKNIYGSSFYDKKFKDELLESEILRDNNSEDSVNVRFYCQSADNNLENKRKIWNRLINEPNFESISRIEEIMNGFVRRDQLDLIKPFVTEEFFNSIEKFCSLNDKEIVNSFVSNFVPHYFVSEELIEKIILTAKKLENFEVANKALLENADQMKRQLKSYAVCEKYANENNIKI